MSDFMQGYVWGAGVMLVLLAVATFPRRSNR